MPILNITRDNYVGGPGIVRINTSDTLAASLTPGYLTSQSLIVALYNNGSFQWVVGDMVALAAADGNALCYFNGSDFTTLISLVPLSSIVLSVLYVTTVQSSMFHTPVGTSWIEYEFAGGGGGGGGVLSTMGDPIAAGGGGGAGSYAKGVFAGNNLVSSYTYEIGGGGAGGVGAADGAAGATSTLGSLVLGGGLGGVFANGVATTVANIADGGLGGRLISGTGLITTAGQEGGAGFSILGQIQSGAGGPSLYDSGGASVNTVQGFANGTNGLQWGSGGSGAAAVSAQTLTGGAGAPGALLMIAYGSPPPY